VRGRLASTGFGSKQLRFLRGRGVFWIWRFCVHELRCGHACGGIHVRNLFLWNSVLVKHLDGTVAEYVHISAAHVALGDSVQQGQHIADSGDIGFAPEPHLHFQMHMSAAPDAPTIRVALRAANGEHVFPVAGRWYSADGKTAAPG